MSAHSKEDRNKPKILKLEIATLSANLTCMGLENKQLRGEIERLKIDNSKLIEIALNYSTY